MEERIGKYKKDYAEDSEIDSALMIGRTDVDSKMVPLYKRLEYVDTGIRDPQYGTRTHFVKEIYMRPSLPPDAGGFIERC